jgi:hypothetical protein
VKTAWLIRHLPREAVLAGNDGWSRTDELLSDQMFVHTGQWHPDDPRLKRQQAMQEQRLKAARRRARARRAQLGITRSVLRTEEMG